MANKDLTFDDMVEYAVSRVIRAFGKGEDLRGACYSIVRASAQWALDVEKEKQNDDPR